MQRGRRIDVSTVLRGLLGAAAAGLIAGACASGGAGRCPQQRWCASATEASAVAEPATGTTFTCPIGLHAGVAREAGQQPPPQLPPDDRVTLDERATQARRNAGDATTCCYAWTEPCKK
ncbi:MAG TPA: hypothetical protein VGB85_03205 [Nannocystis sp.]|jgi:hypothetical protein